MPRPRSPGANEVESPTASHFSKIMDRHPEYPQRQLALDSGFSKNSANCIMTQIKNGRTILPIKYIEPICKNLNEDPAPLFQTALKEYYPEIVGFLERSNTYLLSEDEVQVIEAYRKAKKVRQEEYTKRILNKAKKELEERGEDTSNLVNINFSADKIELKTQFQKNDNEELVSHLKPCVHVKK